MRFKQDLESQNIIFKMSRMQYKTIWHIDNQKNFNLCGKRQSTDTKAGMLVILRNTPFSPLNYFELLLDHTNLIKVEMIRQDFEVAATNCFKKSEHSFKEWKDRKAQQRNRLYTGGKKWKF